jgi:hypothetical protein
MTSFSTIASPNLTTAGAAAVAAAGSSSSSSSSSSSLRRPLPSLPLALQQKGNRARAALKKAERAAACKKLRHSLSDGPPVTLPAVNTSLNLPQISTLLSRQENAAIQQANYKEGKRPRHPHAKEVRQVFLQLVRRFARPGATDAQILSRITSYCSVQAGDGRAINKVPRTTRLSWIKKYKELARRGRVAEALDLDAVTRKARGCKPVFPPEVLNDISKTVAAWLQTTSVGLSIDFVVAHLQALQQTPAKAHWDVCIKEYNKRRVTRPFEFNNEWVRLHMGKWGFSFRVAPRD